MSCSYKYLSTVFFFLLPFIVPAFGVLTHEAIVDASWDQSIVVLLKEKFPQATDSALKEAHAYAYGGAVSPDMGFYPFGSKLFTLHIYEKKLAIRLIKFLTIILLLFKIFCL